MDHNTFEAIVREAIESVPDQFRHALENVAIVVKDEPDPQDLTSLGTGGSDHELFGLYHGVPLTERGVSHTGLPDRIEIYRGPILRSCSDSAQVMDEIRDTLIHELGHHLGLDDDQMAY